MEVEFTDKTILPIKSFSYDSLIDSLFINTYCNDFNSLINLFSSKEKINKIVIKNDDGTISQYNEYKNFKQFCGIFEEGKFLVSVVLSK